MRTSRPGWLAATLITLAIGVVLLGLGLVAVAPVDLQPAPGSRSLLDKDGRVLRGFADAQGVWRLPVEPEQVSPYYLQALIGYEDRFFYDHPGVNPVALLRAAWLWLKHGRIVSGGSTLTMQVARLRYPESRTLWGKSQEILRALLLEWRYSKREILRYYLDHAPFGGTLQGVQAASLAYFGHSAEHLTRAQAALLAILPQAPSRYRPDRYPLRARNARDKLLERLQRVGVWSAAEVADARLEAVDSVPLRRYSHAPLLARRALAENSADKVRSLIDADWQIHVEKLLRRYVRGIGPRVSAAALVMENASGAVRVYAGSADFGDAERFAHVDMVQAVRSPGSTLKPFIYGLALDDGLIHSESLLMDVPMRFGDYQPENFDARFSGPVSVTEALQRSLNVPAVQVLERLGPIRFYLALQRAGIVLELPGNARPSLAVALGGVGARLENLVAAYSSLANQGRVLRPRLWRAQRRQERPLLSPGAAWLVRRILEDTAHARDGLAIKTGTSYGYRDAWALAVSATHTLGVWVGRPDATPLPGHFGGLTAVPLLRQIHRYRLRPRPPLRTTPPPTLTQASICWPSGGIAAAHCDQRRDAWILNRIVPPSWMETKARQQSFQDSEFGYWAAADSGLRVTPGCTSDAHRVVASLWPKYLQAWLAESRRTVQRLPAWDPRCALADPSLSASTLAIDGLDAGDAFLLDGLPQLELELEALGGDAPYHWLLDGRPLPQTGRRLQLRLDPQHRYRLAVLDRSGQSVVRVFGVYRKP